MAMTLCETLEMVMMIMIAEVTMPIVMMLIYGKIDVNIF